VVNAAAEIARLDAEQAQFLANMSLYEMDSVLDGLALVILGSIAVAGLIVGQFELTPLVVGLAFGFVSVISVMQSRQIPRVSPGVPQIAPLETIRPSTTTGSVPRGQPT
jgi:hypothetical protein